MWDNVVEWRNAEIMRGMGPGRREERRGEEVDCVGMHAQGSKGEETKV